MARVLTLLVVCYLGFVQPSYAAEAVIVVANTADKSIQLSRQQVRNLFMGGALPYDLDAVALPPENHTRVLFNTKVVGLTESRIQSYWAQMRFTGRKKGPVELKNEKLVVEYLMSNVGTIGYLPAGMSIPDELTVLYSTN
ncbi:MAG: hypothetical protein ABJK37_22795 [Paraglaciecola sp.]|uniref:hypothetical protein n=1 Tax=Paraglaciecola sp. TaxID=1920173 RepID=UPI00329941FE